MKKTERKVIVLSLSKISDSAVAQQNLKNFSLFHSFFAARLLFFSKSFFFKYDPCLFSDFSSTFRTVCQLDGSKN